MNWKERYENKAIEDKNCWIEDDYIYNIDIGQEYADRVIMTNRLRELVGYNEMER